MGDIINLNQFRKEQQRTQKKAQAAENRTSFGRSKAERESLRAEQQRRQRELDNKQISERDTAGGPSREDRDGDAET